MSGKKVWVTWLPSGAGAPQPAPALAALSGVGLAVSGAPWVDDLERAGWVELADMLTGADRPDIFLVAGRQADFAQPRLRYGLSLVQLRLAAAGENAPVPVVLGLDGPPLADADPWPTPFRRIHAVTADANSPWAAKIVPFGFKKPMSAPTDYRLDIIAHEALGQWLEVGPAAGQWDGAMIGVTGQDVAIEHHAVGPRGQLPERTTLEYATQGIEADVAGEAYEIWSVQNRLTEADSYFVKVTGFPDRLVFAGYDGRSDGDVTVIALT